MWLDQVLSSPLPGEHVIFYLRRHWFTFFLELLKYLLLLVVPVLLALVFIRYLPDRWEILFNGELTEILVKLAVSIYYLGVWVFFWTAWVDYYLDVWLVTNERIISIEQKGLFNRFRSELRLSRVEDATTEVKGVFPTMLHYGNIIVQTAGMEQNTIFRNVSDPYQVAEKIIKLTDGWHKIHPAQQSSDHHL
ncbi:MAG: PH domain-containing protein [Patescibacteria group bacterium]